MLNMGAQLIGPGIRLNNTKLNLKSGGFGSAVEWHQDLAFYPHTNDDLLAVGVCMDDMMLLNGCLLVIPGSVGYLLVGVVAAAAVVNYVAGVRTDAPSRRAARHR